MLAKQVSVTCLSAVVWGKVYGTRAWCLYYDNRRHACLTKCILLCVFGDEPCIIHCIMVRQFVITKCWLMVVFSLVNMWLAYMIGCYLAATVILYCFHNDLVLLITLFDVRAEQLTSGYLFRVYGRRCSSCNEAT